ncbi:MAG: leucine-rich repeat protein [Clostridia bacterium]|nr:leucine-rich repeat protein [Clostridia bacterium]
MLKIKKYHMKEDRERSCGRYSYRFRWGGAVLTAYSGSRDELVVPERLAGLPVVGVAGAFAAAHLRCVVLPKTLRYIGPGSFSLCRQLRAVVIPAGVTRIAPDAFANSTPATLYVTEGSAAHRWAQKMGQPFTLGMPDEALGADDLIFGDFTCALQTDGSLVIREYNGSAEVLEIPAMLGGRPVTRLGVMSFAQHPTLREVTVPEGVRALEGGVFVRCEALRRVTLPDSVTEMGPAVFQQAGLEEVRLPGGLCELPNATFYGNVRLERIELPESIRTIGRAAFYGCMLLREAALPGNLRSIGSGAFYFTSLKSVELPDGLEVIGDEAFASCYGLVIGSLPESVVSVGEDAFDGCTCLWEPEEESGDGWSMDLMLDDVDFGDCDAGADDVEADNLRKLLGRPVKPPKEEDDDE